MRKVFISYRRSDSADATGRIYDHLSKRLGRKVVFIDIDAIPVGDDYVKQIDSVLATCDVALVVIGNEWLNVTDSSGKRRIEDEADTVRLEVEAALQSRAKVIPVLVKDGTMPSEDELPQSLRPISRINAAMVRAGSDFELDMAKLQRIVRRHQSSPSRILLRVLLVALLVLVTGIGGAVIWRNRDQLPFQRPTPAAPELPTAENSQPALSISDIIVQPQGNSAALLDVFVLNDGETAVSISRLRVHVLEHFQDVTRGFLEFSKVYDDAAIDLSDLQEAGQTHEVVVSQSVSAGEVDRFGVVVCADRLLEASDVLAGWKLKIELVTSDGIVSYEAVKVELAR